MNQHHFIRNLICSGLLLFGAGSAKAQTPGLQDVIVEEFHTITTADADAYNNVHGGGSTPLAAGMKVYRVYIDLEPNWRLASVFAINESPLAIRTTTTFWNDDNWGSQFPAQTRRLDEGALFDSFITINTSGTSGGAAGCGQNTTQFGVRRSVDSNGDLTTCGVYPSFTGTDGHIPAAFPMDPITTLGPIDFQALTSDPAPTGLFSFSSALWGYVGGISGVDPAGDNIVFVGQFTTDGVFSFEINVGLNGPNGEAISYVHTPAAGATVSAKLVYPLQNDCNGVPGGPNIPGAPCNDNNVCTENDTWNASCQCVGTPLIDADDDGVCDANDPCPLLPNLQPGDACDDGNPGTINDVVNASCVCAGVPAGPGCDFNALEIVVVNDAVSIVTYEVRVQGTNALAANGTVNPPAGAYTLDICLPNGCYYLVVTDDGGDGIVGGGYVLRLAGGDRIIDNAGNMSEGLSQIEGNEGFCLPIGTDRLTFDACDRIDWRPVDYVKAEINPAVSAQFGGANAATSGYQMWWYNPNGGYSFKRFQSHNTANGLAASPTRARFFRVNGWSGNQLQVDVLYNVKVRSRIAGVYAEWGPACRFIYDPLRADCPLTKLMDVPGNQYFSCGATRAWGGNSFITARPVTRPVPGGVQSPNRYQFRFRQLNEALVTIRTSNTYHLPLNWSPNPLVPGQTYLVDVRVSFDGGATWCNEFIPPSLDPWGDVCTLTISGASSMALEPAAETLADARMSLFPNPNRGDQLFLSLNAIEEGVEKVTVDIFDSFGKRVAQRTIGVSDGHLNTALELNGSLSAGLYLVTLSAGNSTFTERLVIQP
ncbi:MAG: T9SS type A sorting domain-containing protein [Flavobacteriales bacterium]